MIKDATLIGVEATRAVQIFFMHFQCTKRLVSTHVEAVRVGIFNHFTFPSQLIINKASKYVSM